MREKYKYFNIKDLDAPAELDFIRVPFEEKNFDGYVSEGTYQSYTYNEIVSGDPTWKVKEEDVAAMQFNFIQTKYFDVR